MLEKVTVYLDPMTRGEINYRVQLPPVLAQLVLVNGLRLVVIRIHTEADHPTEVIIIATTPHHDLIQRNQFILINDQAAVSKIPSSLVIVQFQLILHHLYNSNLEYNSNTTHNIRRHRYFIITVIFDDFSTYF